MRDGLNLCLVSLRFIQLGLKGSIITFLYHPIEDKNNTVASRVESVDLFGGGENFLL